MKIADISPDVLDKIKALRYDELIEKHEGPWKWGMRLNMVRLSS